jgi:translation initiation factor 4A
MMWWPTGTGKTATFAISTLQSLDTSARECRPPLPAPTRELAQQNTKVNDQLPLTT